METTDKISCLILADVLASAGVKRAVLCPGSRNAPLIVAFSRDGRFDTRVVVDERSAAFMALGLSTVSGEPVAVVCTSGSALLNMAPAVSEAYYRHVPLVVVSADRPIEWIDQDDSQTIRQRGALDAIVKASADISEPDGNAIRRRYMTRTLNDVMSAMAAGCPGPVHINVQIDEPLDRMCEAAAPGGSGAAIRVVRTEGEVDRKDMARLADELCATGKVMIIAGFHEPDGALQSALRTLGSRPNVAVLHEAQSNMHSKEFVSRIDATLSVLDSAEAEKMRPELVITLGGSLVSRMVKTYLRTTPCLRHWHVSEHTRAVDCFLALDTRIEARDTVFFSRLAAAVARRCPTDGDYASRWQDASRRAAAKVDDTAAAAPWCDFEAMYRLMAAVPRKWNLQLSNGTAVRYAQLMDCRGMHRIDCNRGVSGIDGCTSTAIGASWAYSGCTLLVSGDMSAQYDVGALAAAGIDSRFKMAVLNNGGGGIFRFIKSTRALPELERCFVADVRLPLRQLADGYGFAYFETDNGEDFEKTFRAFAAESRRPAILNIVTPGDVSARVLTDFFNRKQ